MTATSFIGYCLLLSFFLFNYFGVVMVRGAVDGKSVDGNFISKSRVICVCWWNVIKSDQRPLINRGIRFLIDRVQKQMPNGFPRLGIQSLAPLYVPNQNFTIGGGQWMRWVHTFFCLGRKRKVKKPFFHWTSVRCVKLKAFYNFHLTKIPASHLTYRSQITNTLIPFDSTNQLHTSHTWHTYTA